MTQDWPYLLEVRAWATEVDPLLTAIPIAQGQEEMPSLDQYNLQLASRLQWLAEQEGYNQADAENLIQQHLPEAISVLAVSNNLSHLMMYLVEGVQV